ncbi:MAG TPA: aminoglycoside phosphotransferase family protein [Gaiellaceae bacterium]|nr:aminoglycoside phosphotransferase family protein [Gaiellaceae bacterium]
MSNEGTREVPLAGGWVTEGVVRVGGTVRRPAGPNSRFVAELLTHLQHVGFDAAPSFLGHDEQGRETLGFLEGDVPSDCRSTVWSDRQLTASMRLLRRFHDHTAGSVVAGTREVVCHNDYGPWNLVWRSGLPVAIIDFDNAAPGSRMDDLAYAAWKHLNLGLLELTVAEQRRRLVLLVHSYGGRPDASLLAAMRSAQARMRTSIESAPYGGRRDEALAQITFEQNWLATYGPTLVS